MMSSRLLFALLATAPFGCASALQPEVASVGPQSPNPAPPESIAGPFVQAGTLFSAQVDQLIDTYYSAPGTPFTATVVNPLFGAQGQLVVPYGAKLRGTIASVGTYELPNIRVALQSIDTVGGPVPIEAAVREAQHYEWLGPDPLSVDYMSRNRDLPDAARSANLFGYQAAYGYDTTQPSEVRIPRGAVMEIALTAPLAPP